MDVIGNVKFGTDWNPYRTQAAKQTYQRAQLSAKHYLSSIPAIAKEDGAAKA
jgi:hypothetical protein